MKWPSLRRRWRLIAIALLATFVIALTLGPQIARPIVRARIQAALADDLDVQVEIGWITWSPFFKVRIHDVALRANDTDGSSFDLLRADQISIALGKAPWSDGPIVIDDVMIDSAALHLIRTKDGIVGLKHDSSSPTETTSSAQQSAEKLSDRLRLHHFNIGEANVEFEDRTTSRPPIALRRIELNVTPEEKSDSRYAIELFTPGGSAPLLHADARFDIDKLLLTMDLSKLKFSPGKTPSNFVRFDGGNIAVNLTSHAFGVNDLKLHISPSADVSDFPAPLADALRQAQPSGELDCQIDASGPLVVNDQSLSDISGEIKISPVNLALHPPQLPLPLTDFEDIAIHVHDGVASAHNIRAGYGDDVFFLESASLPLKNILHDQLLIDSLSGCLTLARQAPKYPPPLDELKHLAQARGPFWFSGSARIDLIDTSKVDYSIHVTTDRAQISSGQFHIPLYNVNTDLLITPAAIDINRFDADVLSGKLSTSGRVNLNEMSYAAQVRVRRVDLNTLAQTAAQPGQKPLTVTGELNCDMNVAGRGTGIAALAALTADGAIQIQQGEMFRIPGLMEVADIVHLGNLATVGDAAITFRLKEKKIHVDPLAIGAPAIGVHGDGDIIIVEDESQKLGAVLDINLVATPFSDWEKNIRRDDNAVANVAGKIAGAVEKGLDTVTENLLYKIHVSGPVQDPKVEALFAPDVQR